jgi:ketosteroid isomerase-like protein
MLSIKGTFFVAFVGLVAAGCNKPTPATADSTLPAGAEKFDPEVARKEIIAADSAWVRAVQAKNVDSLMPYYASDAVSMSEGTKAADGTKDIRAAYQQMVKTNPRNLKFKVESVVFSDDGTMATDYGSVSGTSDGPAGKPVNFTGNYMNVWQKVNGRWVLIAEISNSAPVSM